MRQRVRAVLLVPRPLPPTGAPRRRRRFKVLRRAGVRGVRGRRGGLQAPAQVVGEEESEEGHELGRGLRAPHQGQEAAAAGTESDTVNDNGQTLCMKWGTVVH